MNAECAAQHGSPGSVLIAGHGTRSPHGTDEFLSLIALVRDRHPDLDVSHAFLELAEPDIVTALGQIVAAGRRDVVVQPAMLLTAGHVKNDFPALLRDAARAHPAARFVLAHPIGVHPLLLALCRLRIEEAESAAGWDTDRSARCLVVAGRGTTDPDTNGDVAKITRLMQETMGFRCALPGFTTTARPGLDDALEDARRLARETMVLPLILFHGELDRRIEASVERARAKAGETRIVRAARLGPHPHLADALAARIREATGAAPSMNCLLCKYRVRMPGAEHDAGTPQGGHGHEHGHGHGHADGPAPERVEAPPDAVCETHPIEIESFRIIAQARGWSAWQDADRALVQRVVHAAGDVAIADDILISPGAVAAGIDALAGGAPVATDVTMVRSGLNRALIARLGLDVHCGVHDEEVRAAARIEGATRSAAGIRQAWREHGDGIVLAIGDAPSALEETVRLIIEHDWRPALVIAFPVGFVGTDHAKQALWQCARVPRITNRGTRGGSPWAAAAVNAIMIAAVNKQGRAEESG